MVIPPRLAHDQRSPYPNPDVEGKSLSVRSGYKHYRNLSEPGDTVFITSTVLDFVYAFTSPNWRMR